MTDDLGRVPLAPGSQGFAPQPPAASSPDGADPSRGTFACPICGDDKPHQHSAPVVDAYQNKGSRK